MVSNLAISKYLQYIHQQLTAFGPNRNFYLGVSGGVDSAVGLAILLELLPPDRVHPFYIAFQETDETLINLLEERFQIPIPRIDLANTFHALESDLQEERPQYTNNWLPKLRSLFLYDQALKNNGLVISCLNYSEYYLGYFTKFGDGQGDFFPLSGLLKSQVYKLAECFNIPQQIIDQPPSPGFAGITDEAELGFSYQVLEQFLRGDRGKVPPETVQKIIRWHDRNRHKLGTIPCLPREDF